MKEKGGGRQGNDMNFNYQDNPMLVSARNELYLSMRYLFLPLNSLEPVLDKSVEAIATDGERMFYNPLLLQQRYDINPVLVNRAYLHCVLHCMFCHPFVKPKNLRRSLWDIACDAAVEYIIDGLELRCVKQLLTLQKEEAYRAFFHGYNSVSAQDIYNYLLRLGEEEQGRLEASGVFTADDHRYWYSGRQDDQNEEQNKRGNQDAGDNEGSGSGVQGGGAQYADELAKRWQQAAKRAACDSEGYAAETGTAHSSLLRAIRPSPDSEFSYKDFLCKFASVREQLRVDADAFDYGFYNYGLMTYDNMPLIEELEYKEEQKIEDFVVVLDTSGSCSGRLVQRFLDETFDVLSTQTMFADRTRIHVIQCDNMVQSDTVITSRQQLNELKDNFEVKGFGGTDFRPAFEYVNELIAKGELDNLRGLLYFTDGHGIYPKAKTPYKTAFIFPSDDEPAAVPPWAIKAVLGKRFMQL